MMMDKIRNALRSHPFQPFAIRLAEGTTYIVHHPDWLYWINIGLILEIIVPAELAASERAGGNGA